MPKPPPDELYHYTSRLGLEGIIRSQTLWATHYKYLNDSEEVSHFRDRLPDILRPVFKNIFIGLTPDQRQLLLHKYPSVEMALEEEPRTLANVMYKVTFGRINKKLQPIAEPYVSSFCTVDKTDQCTVNHGLLSQWRGYGGEGGYIIVFDSAGLEQLLREEAKRWSYSVVFAGDVLYSTATDDEFYDEFSEHIDAIQNNWIQTFRTLRASSLGDTYKQFLSCACRYKHWGFSEEKEFRIVVAPTSPHIVRIAKRKRKTNLPQKPINYFFRNGMKVPYVSLFDGITKPWQRRLPIKRIIIGPHPEKAKRKIDIEKLLKENGIDTSVSVSDIPYLGSPTVSIRYDQKD